jgi:hypothetical protein
MRTFLLPCAPGSTWFPEDVRTEEKHGRRKADNKGKPVLNREVNGLNNSRFLFTDLTDEARSVKPSYYFMMRSLLHSRIDTGMLSDTDGEEEDVNVYLAHLLQSFSDPVYLESAKPYLHRYDHEVFGRLSLSTDARLKYKIYKTNADFLLVSIGVFDNPSQALLNQVPGWSASSPHGPTEEATMGRGRTYYQFAYEYSQLLSQRHPAITEVLEKLARGFDRYTQILAHLRGEYLDLVHQLSEGEIYHLERSVNREQNREALRERQDAFLDAYATWRRTGREEDQAKMNEAGESLRELDPDFHFGPGSMESREREDNGPPTDESSEAEPENP